MNNVIKYLKSKTVWFGAALVAFGAVQTYLPEFREILTAETYAVATSIVGAVVIVLRAITKGSLDDKVDDGSIK